MASSNINVNSTSLLIGLDVKHDLKLPDKHGNPEVYGRILHVVVDSKDTYITFLGEDGLFYTTPIEDVEISTRDLVGVFKQA